MKTHSNVVRGRSLCLCDSILRAPSAGKTRRVCGFILGGIDSRRFIGDRSEEVLSGVDAYCLISHLDGWADGKLIPDSNSWTGISLLMRTEIGLNETSSSIPKVVYAKRGTVSETIIMQKVVYCAPRYQRIGSEETHHHLGTVQTSRPTRFCCKIYAQG